MQVAAADQQIVLGEEMEVQVSDSGTQELLFTPEITGSYGLVTEKYEFGRGWNQTISPRMVMLGDQGEQDVGSLGNWMYRDFYLIKGKTYKVILSGEPGDRYRVTLKFLSAVNRMELEKLYTPSDSGETSALYTFQAPQAGLYAITATLPGSDLLGTLHLSVLNETSSVMSGSGMLLLPLQQGEECLVRIGVLSSEAKEWYDAAFIAAYPVTPQTYTFDQKQNVSYGQALQLQVPEDGQYDIGFQKNPIRQVTPDLEYVEVNGTTWEVTVLYDPDFYVFDENFKCVDYNQRFEHSSQDDYIVDHIDLSLQANQTYYIVPNYLAKCPNLRVTAYWENYFEDVPFAAWYYDAVRYTYENGLFAGVTNYQFAPDTAMNRAMLVSVLYRMAGSPDVTGLEQPFTDVVSGSWYEKAVSWAADVGVVAGVSSDRFAPNDLVTREQMVSMLYRYVQKVEKQPADARADLQGFTDQNQISNYALEPMQWAVAEEIVHGVTPTTLAPKQSTTRAQAAMLLMGLQK